MLSNHDSIAAKSAPRIAIRGRCVASPTLVSQVRRIHPCMVQNLCTTRGRVAGTTYFRGRNTGSQAPRGNVYWCSCRMLVFH